MDVQFSVSGRAIGVLIQNEDSLGLILDMCLLGEVLPKIRESKSASFIESKIFVLFALQFYRERPNIGQEDCLIFETLAKRYIL
jgi:hypothetical protein